MINELVIWEKWEKKTHIHDSIIYYNMTKDKNISITNFLIFYQELLYEIRLPKCRPIRSMGLTLRGK